MKDLYLLSLLGLLATEYGFRSRAQILQGLRAGWRWSGTAARAGLWIAYGLSVGLLGELSLSTLLAVAAGILLSEAAAYILRHYLQATIRNGAVHGSVRAHLSVLLLGLFSPVGLVLLSSLIASDPVVPPGPGIGALLAWATLIVASWTWGTLLTVSVIDLVRPDVLAEQDQGASDWGRGEVIGILERLITLGLFAAGAPTAVGLVVAAKAAARFPEFDDSEFAEYFLVGTLASVGLAVAGGLLVRSLNA